MQDLEPFYNWNHLYDSSNDELSPFYGKQYLETEYSNTIYNYYIHPHWDYFGSSTMYLKVLYVDYLQGYSIIELIGEWNDCLNNDIMLLKRDLIDDMLREKINKFILVGENVLNFHPSDDCYYQEWFDDVEDGWIALVNFREHVLQEFTNNNIDFNVVYGGELNKMYWRKLEPGSMFHAVEGIINHRLV